MHIPDGVLDPSICLIAGGLSAAGVGYSLYRLRDSLADRTIPITGMTASLIFAAQMVNFPLIVAPVSGHLLGGVLAAAILGPWGGCVAVSMVLFIQVALFADGGWMALGANVLNMAIVGCWGGSLVLGVARRLIRDPSRGLIVGAMWGAWLTVMMGAVFFCLEFACSKTAQGYPMGQLIFLMLGFHSVIGIGEAVITGLILKYLVQVRPDLVAGNTTPVRSRFGIPLTLAGGLLAVAIVVLGAPFASNQPDGLEAVGERMQFNELSKPTWSIWLQDYSLPWLGARWESLGTVLVGLVGTLIVFVLTVPITRSLKSGTIPGPQDFGPSSLAS